MFGVGQWELFVILLVILLVFGAKRIPDMAQGLGKGIREFRKAMREVQGEIDVDGNARAAQRPQQLDTAPPRQTVPQQAAQAAQPAPSTQPKKPAQPAATQAADDSANPYRLT